ncbi:polymorphic toxin-type HINT domain-containing protein [Actinoplanes sp. NPDC049118]|uniref:polymorphic toxin-type HINT domain-containing protein n=1 Tax=Actinoplanes sp. NPDC049118 TaxID=3155769 RepID=UPI0033C0BE43
MTQKQAWFSPGRRRFALGAAALMVTGLLTYHWVAPEFIGERDVESVAAKDFGTVRVTPVPLPADGGTWTGPAKGRWPAAGSTEIALTGSAGRAVSAKAGSIPVTVKAVPGKKAPDRVRVSTLPEEQSTKLGVSGPVIAVEVDKSGDLETTVDYGDFADLYGGGWAGRLNLAQLPSCAATTPERPECQEATPLRAAKGGQRLAAGLTVSSAAPTVMTLAADTESGEGDYKASDLQASGSWTAGDGSGGFSYTNAIKLPPAPGPTPEVALSYSSQMVDGRMAGNNNQASWAGDGWDYSPGLIERSYVGCADDLDKADDKDPNNKEKKTADQCWKDKSPNITVSLGGSNATLIKDDATGAWRAAQDANWKVEHEGAVADKDSATTERWVITTPDGTRHFFAGEVATSVSRLTVPVFGNHAGEYCHATAFKDSSCQQAWRWLLDKEIDVNGNMTRYYYRKETGHYGAAGDKANRVSFDRGGNLERIEYGLNTAYPDVAATARVVFSTANRCFADECYKDDKPVKANWPDVPWDKECTAEPCTDKLAPVFFSIKRLTKITTEIRSGSSFNPVESWTLDQEFKAPKAAQSASLWLKSITHAGHVGGTITDPPVSFTGVELANQVNAIAGAALFSRWRIDNIRTESGADIHVTYSDPDCDAGDLPDVTTNSRLCYPVYWTPDGYFEPTRDWFRKYVVREVTHSDRTADQPPITTRYEYSTDGGGTNVLWGWDDGEFLKKKHRTYGQWRGYSQVTARIGQSDTGRVLATRKRFYRGLDDQPLPADKTRSVQVTDSAGRTYTDHPALAGSLLEEAKLDGTAVAEAQSTAYWVKQTAVRARTGGSDKSYRIAPSTQKSRRLMAPGVWQQTETRTEYSDEGQAESISELGDTDKAGDETCTRLTYVNNDDPWLRGRVSREEKVAKACTAAVSRPADLISDVKTYYDKSETHGSAPTKGQVTRVDTLNTWTSGAPVYTTTGRTGYDGLGRENSKTDELGKVTTTTYTPAGPGPVTQTRTLNPLKHEVITDQDPAWAEPTSILDANKKRTDLAHDAMGRLAKVWLPGRAKATATPSMEFDYKIRNDGPLAVTTRRLGPNGNYLTEVGLFDSLYRSIQTQEVAQKTKEGKDARLVSTTGYNDRGQVEFKSDENYGEGRPSIERARIEPGEDRSRTVSTYDRLGRVVEEALWSNNTRKWSTFTAYGGNPAGWQTAVTPPAGGTPSATIENAAGDVVEKREFHGSRPEGDFDATKYTYSPRGDLATVAKGAFTWEYEYDLRGREVKTTDPDKGITTVEYNNADDVTKSTDAKGDVVSTTYDDLGRQKERLFNGVKAAAWTYDTVAKGHPTKSTSIVNGFSFSKEIFEYNDAYQVVDEESVIPAMPGLTALAGTYVTTNTYTVNGLPFRSSLPKVGPMEKEGITRTYDDLGNVVKLAGTSSPSGTTRTYVDRTTYSPYGEVLNRWLGTPVGDKPQAYQNYVYDDVTRRLSEFYFDRDGTVPNVAALKYEYDDAGNVLSMANRPVDADNNPRPGEADVQCFDYDHLRRLTQAWSQASTGCETPAAGGKAPYWKSWTFDQHGSRDTTTDHVTGKTSDYGYDATTHALRTVTTGDQVEHYDWDERGNLEYRKIGDRSETFTWSPHGKLTKISGPEGDTTMVYDVDGNRIARVDPGGAATVFVYGHEYTTTPTQGTGATRYYEHAGDTIASRTDTTTRKGDIIWLGSDQQDSATWAVNSATRAATIRYNDPYGNARDASAAVQWPAGQRGFVGGVADPTGLTMLGARFYDPRTGSFISVDPEVDEYDPQRLHPYAYANNNPTTFSDPDGLFWGAIKNGFQKAASAVASGVTSAAKAVVNNAGTIASVAGTVAMVATFLPPPAQIVAAAAGAVAAVAGAIDTAKSCAGGDKLGCATGIAGMIPGVRQAKTAARGAGGLKGLLKRAGKGCNSFPPGTKVLMADGSSKNIEDVELDDEVRATDPKTGEDGARPVTALITGHGDKHLVKVSVDVDGDGTADDSLTATDGHPFWVESERQWLTAAELKTDMALLTPDGARVTVIAVVAWDAVATVHNLTVDDIHTYYVTVGDAKVLVHNVGDDECPVDPDGYRAAWNESNPQGAAEKYKRRKQFSNMKGKDRKEALKDNPVCVYCGRAKSEQADHIFPVKLYHYARGWWRTKKDRSAEINQRGNLTGACQPCNGSKGGRRLGMGPGMWWPPGWGRGVWWPFGGGPR